MATSEPAPELELNASLANASVANGTLSATPSLLESIYLNRHFVFVQLRIFALTLTILYTGAHSALHRPFSAAVEKESDDESAKRRRQRHAADASAKNGIRTSDALMIPIFASLALTGMYYLIQYMGDPNLLSRFLRAYMSVVGVVCLSKLLGDSMNLLATVLFPNVWVGRVDGRPTLLRIDPVRRCQSYQPQGNTDASANSWTVDSSRSSPFPDRLAWLVRTPSARATAWTARRFLREDWSIRMAMYGIGDVDLDASLSSLLGIVLSAVLSAAYCFTSASSSEVLRNTLGLSLCYGSLILVSCTTFGIGSLVLGVLFVYDIVMVFFTPVMIKVASSVDAPMKITARSGDRASLLGLGDIVVPGIFISMCLRYDLYQFYARRIKHVPTKLETVTKDSAASGNGAPETSVLTVKDLEVKMPYVDPQGRWGDRLWTMGLGRAMPNALRLTPGLHVATFPKPLFMAAMVGYFVGLVLAIGVMFTTNHGQPALMYLVPSILLATWGWSLVTGELKDMWNYTEDDSTDVKDVVVEVGPDGKPVEKQEKAETQEKEGDGIGEEDILLLSLRAPAEAPVEEVDI